MFLTSPVCDELTGFLCRSKLALNPLFSACWWPCGSEAFLLEAESWQCPAAEGQEAGTGSLQLISHSWSNGVCPKECWDYQYHILAV